jgi:hypothetical protein
MSLMPHIPPRVVGTGRFFLARLYQAASSPRSTGGTGGPRFRCPSPRLPFKRVNPSLLDLAAHGRTRHPGPPETSPNLPSRSPKAQSPLHLATVRLALSKYRERDPRRGARSLGLAPKKNALRPTLQLSRARSWKPGHLRSAYGAICCHKFKPKNITDDIFLAQILGHKLLGPNASLSVGQSYKDFYIRDIP